MISHVGQIIFFQSCVPNYFVLVMFAKLAFCLFQSCVPKYFVCFCHVCQTILFVLVMYANLFGLFQSCVPNYFVDGNGCIESHLMQLKRAASRKSWTS